MVGSTVRRIIDQTIIGSVVSLPLTNTVMINSSNDRANTRMAAPIRLGRRIGRVTMRNACSGLAPRSRAASSREGSK
ncbi:hypothetical protein D3C76_1372980 [compost metagenome]